MLINTQTNRQIKGEIIKQWCKSSNTPPPQHTSLSHWPAQGIKIGSSDTGFQALVSSFVPKASLKLLWLSAACWYHFHSDSTLSVQGSGISLVVSGGEKEKDGTGTLYCVRSCPLAQKKKELFSVTARSTMPMGDSTICGPGPGNDLRPTASQWRGRCRLLERELNWDVWAGWQSGQGLLMPHKLS